MAHDDIWLRGMGCLLALALAPAFWPVSASASPENRDEICQGYKGTALWGQCTRAVAAGCNVSEHAPPTCARWAERWLSQAGTEPPWLVCGGDGSCTVFVTSQTFSNGNRGGLGGADTECNDLAAATNLPGEYKAWLSDVVADESPSTRFSTVGMSSPYVLADAAKTRVAASWSALTSGTIDTPINVDETGQTVPPGKLLVWTGTNTVGGPTGSDCDGWRDDTDNFEGTLGQTNQTDADWTESSGVSCDEFILSLGHYCFEQ
jgi:hypothetical protein